LIWAGAAAAVAFSVARFVSRKPDASTRVAIAPVASAAAGSAAPATISIQASASPVDATLYLDGERLPSNPYVGRMPADGIQHLIRAEAPGYTSGNRAFVANREVAIILALARPDGPLRVEGKKVRPTTVSPPAGSSPVEPTTTPTDDCKVSPYYMDDRNIKVVRPECLRAIQLP
jgi:serine/threonine-protein kinase